MCTHFRSRRGALLNHSMQYFDLKKCISEMSIHAFSSKTITVTPPIKLIREKLALLEKEVRVKNFIVNEVLVFVWGRFVLRRKKTGKL